MNGRKAGTSTCKVRMTFDDENPDCAVFGKIMITILIIIILNLLCGEKNLVATPEQRVSFLLYSLILAFLS